MTRPIVKIHDLTTGEIEEREMNDTEFAEFEADEATHQAAREAQEAKAIAREAILDRLGITAEEASLLLS